MSNQLHLFRNGYEADPDIWMLGYLSNIGDVINNQVNHLADTPLAALHTFNEAERAGSEWHFAVSIAEGVRNVETYLMR